MKTNMLIIFAFLMVSYACNSTAQQNHEYVDLGLPSGTLWATCNIGASNSWENGDYFAWGETNPKNEYSEYTYTYRDNPETLPPSQDAATVNWGSDWCMPTQQQCQELSDNCTWTWTTLNGKNGYEVKSENGNSIFLPASGWMWPSLEREGQFGFYRSSSLGEGESVRSLCLGLASGQHRMGYNYRAFGFPVRAVRCK